MNINTNIERIKFIAFAILFLIANYTFSQTTTTVTVSNGDGWYRIIEGGGNTSSLVRISGISGSNRATDISMYVSLMAYNQGGSINIVNNKYYNINHVSKIRGGTSNGKYVLDIYSEGINNPTNINITTDSAIVLSSPIYNPIDDIVGKVEISGRVIGTSSTRHSIYFSGKVGIGTTTPDEKLSVNGYIHTKEVRVDLTGWSDFVFEDSYKLPSLNEVENHIMQNGHLKDIPSAKEVAENGILIGEMNAKLLRKIEELTLYTIEQEKKIDVQNKAINQQGKENKNLKSQVQDQNIRMTKLETIVEQLLKNSK